MAVGKRIFVRKLVSSVVISRVIFISRALKASPCRCLIFHSAPFVIKGPPALALFRGTLGPQDPLAPFSLRFDFSRDVRREAFRRMNS